MTDHQCAEWLTCLGFLIDNERALTRPGYGVEIELTPDNAMQIGGVLRQAAEALLAAPDRYPEEPEDAIPAAYRVSEDPSPPFWEMTPADWAAVYARCGSVESVAKSLGCNYATARKYLRRFGIVTEPARAIPGWPCAQQLTAALVRARNEEGR